MSNTKNSKKSQPVNRSLGPVGEPKKQKIGTKSAFATLIIAWYRKNGRDSLPWQSSNEPYPRWISEIMLQQTQVVTVIPYFLRFIKRFPDLKTLATSDLDEVLSYWTGLGYYARARNLYHTALIIKNDYQCNFPETYEAIIQLPGIGRSTAGAILSFCFDKPYPVLDGNVRRVLARYHAVGGWPGQKEVAKRLWQFAEMHTPKSHIGEYTQGIMDVGSGVCLAKQPLCAKCPVKSTCKAFEEKDFLNFPGAKPKKNRSHKKMTMVMIRDKLGNVFLHQRPITGIWGGLWSFPECPQGLRPEVWIQETFGLYVRCEEPWEGFCHQLSHVDLEIRPLPAILDKPKLVTSTSIWYKPGMPIKLGLSSPVTRLLEQLKDYPI